MTQQLVLFFIVLSLNACVPTPATEQQKKDAMKNARFDQNVVSNMDKYEDLRMFLEENIDTIIKFRYSNNSVGGEAPNYLADDICYNFFQGNSRHDISNVPDYLKKQLDSLFHSFPDKDLKSFAVCKNKKISIGVRNEAGDYGLYISHNLLWNTNIERDNAYDNNKDSLLNNNCIYRIGLTEHHGH